MIKKLALVFVAVSLMAAPAVLADNILEASAETSEGDYIVASADDNVGWVFVNGHVNGSGFICFEEGIFGLVDVIASAKRGTLDEVDTGDLKCFGGTPLILSRQNVLPTASFLITKRETAQENMEMALPIYGTTTLRLNPPIVQLPLTAYSSTKKTMMVISNTEFLSISRISLPPRMPS